MYIRDDLSFFFWNDVGAQIAVQTINHDQSILPSASIIIKRFNDFDPRFLDSPGDSSGYAIQVALQIQQDHPDVVAVFGGLMTGTALKTAEVYQLPYCTAYQQSSRLLNRNLYPYYFSLIPNSGMAHAFCLLLKTWNVKRVGLITSTGSKEIINGLGACGIRILTVSKIDKDVSLQEIEEIGRYLQFYDARYVILDSDPVTSGFVYFTLAALNICVGADYVWIGTNYAYPIDDGIRRIGPFYNDSLISDYMFLQGENPKDENFTDLFQYYVDMLNVLAGTNISSPTFDPLNGMSAFDCIGVLARGFYNALEAKSNPQLNASAFSDTGYSGFTGHPLELSKGGDIKVSYLLFQLDETYWLHEVGRTATDNGDIIFSNSTPPLFHGSLEPPPDGTITYKLETIAFSDVLGYATVFMLAIGLAICLADFVLILVFRNKQCIRSSSIAFSFLTIFGASIGFLNGYFILGIPTGWSCVGQTVTASLSFAIVSVALIIKNARIGMIFSSKTALAKRYLKISFALYIAFVGIFVEVVLLAVWLYFSKIIVSTKEFAEKQVIEFYCINESSDGKKFGVAIMVYNIFLAASTVFTAYCTRQVKSSHSETSFLSLIIVSTILFQSINFLLRFVAKDSQMILQFSNSLLIWCILIQVVFFKFAGRVSALLADKEPSLSFLKVKSVRGSRGSRVDRISACGLNKQTIKRVKTKAKPCQITKQTVYGIRLLYKVGGVFSEWIQATCLISRIRNNVFLLLIPREADANVNAFSIPKATAEYGFKVIIYSNSVTLAIGAGNVVFEFGSLEHANKFKNEVEKSLNPD
ncbi:periplasmic binding protein-like I [Obelidium mucronatum]|nr:periplasmic binding protein-like I [Obelidium mucronatum]